MADLSRQLEAVLRAPAAPGSLAAADDALPDARFVTLYADQALAVAIDHLNAWRLLVNGPEIPILAHITLLRGALEGAARCRWHLDATVDSGTRVGRGLASRRDDQRERRKFETSPEGGARWQQGTRGLSAAQRLAEIDDPERVKAREVLGIREVAFTDTTSLMRAQGHERWFRLASAMAHGKEWAFAATIIEESAEPPQVSEVRHGYMSASEPVAVALTGIAVDAVRGAVSELAAYRSARRRLAPQ
ncbi:MAG TPA: hypothetical protein VF302_10430 [Candidatus Limnocylindrales bacterium]